MSTTNLGVNTNFEGFSSKKSPQCDTFAMQMRSIVSVAVVTDCGARNRQKNMNSLSNTNKPMSIKRQNTAANHAVPLCLVC